MALTETVSRETHPAEDLCARCIASMYRMPYYWQYRTTPDQPWQNIELHNLTPLTTPDTQVREPTGNISNPTAITTINGTRYCGPCAATAFRM